MKNLRFETEHYYFCGNCEDEVRGYPYGHRVPDMRPLCDKCSRAAEKMGVGRRNPRMGNNGPNLALLIFGVACMLFILALAKMSLR